MVKQRKFLFLASIMLLARGVLAEDKPKVEFQDGDRIAFIGNEFFEREADCGYIETALTTRFSDKNLTFRNLGYSGDTVRADARNLCSGWATFGPADQGFDRLKNLVEHIKPTVVFVAYGMNESFEGLKGVGTFEQGLNRMLDMVSASGASGMRIVLISPIRHEDLGRPLPDPTEHNKNIVLYTSAIEKVARERRCAFINLFEALGDGTKDEFHTPFTSDGIHLTAYGYWRTAMVLEHAMGYGPRGWSIDLEARPGAKPKAQGAKMLSVEWGPENSLSLGWKLVGATLPIAPAPPDSPKALREEGILPDQQHVVRLTGLPAGKTYVLKFEDQTVTATGREWAKGIQVFPREEFNQVERLRACIVAKNFDFFNFWRPDNDTYIFGYRKHEQGRNAVEIPRFEPLVEQKEARIAEFRVPLRHTYLLTGARPS
jgi:lysophospholipase L1-like esterase